MTMPIKLLIITMLLVAAGLVINLFGFGLPAAGLSVTSLAVLWWFFIRKPVRGKQSPGPPVSCCHYLGDSEAEDGEDNK